ncbi:C40 family peptidase [Paenibacillus frigoriresistens]|uniref:C40 family peptidase n=1 Tax=Paenibacillus alginolyticus TaxID=59839 RepID=UPI001567B694|nr:C40 family peptidase [Paenibacillus frigoriresistens]NRF94037.1 C40 family peptidase [Paenibacillus frigoriresistens]
MSTLKRKMVAVSVATVWTKPESPRPMDELALKEPARIREWLESMTLQDKLDLCLENRVQTQVLYGSSVFVSEEHEGWSKVLIPQQGTRKDAIGYPGWVPSCQLVDEAEAPVGTKRAEVISDQAWLYKNPSEPLMELSYLTSLPVLEIMEEWVKVHTPDGMTYLKTDDIHLIDGPLAPRDGEGHIGRGIVEQGKRFLNLPYLWGGMSSFGYDCSGFAYAMHRYVGILIPRDASDQAKQGTLIDKDQLELGDLLFFAHEEGKGAIHHVGIYAGDNQMIHSPETIKCIEIVDLRTFNLAKEHCASRRYWK